MRLLGVLGLLLVALVAAGCGSDEDEGTEPRRPSRRRRSRCRRRRPSSPPGETLTEPEFTLTEPGGASVTVPPASSERRARPSSPSACGSSARTAARPRSTRSPATRRAARCPSRRPPARRSRPARSTSTPVPPDSACTMIYGGPAVAEVTGTVFGEAGRRRVQPPGRLPHRQVGLGDRRCCRPTSRRGSAATCSTRRRPSPDRPPTRSVRSRPVPGLAHMNRRIPAGRRARRRRDRRPARRPRRDLLRRRRRGRLAALLHRAGDAVQDDRRRRGPGAAGRRGRTPSRSRPARTPSGSRSTSRATRS